MCEICQNWERVEDPYKIRSREGLPLATNHHPNCPHYNDSLMDVWMVGEGPALYFDNEKDALAEPIDPDMKVIKITMHREVFTNLPEFHGF